jgi:hypothetical protein
VELEQVGVLLDHASGAWSFENLVHALLEMVAGRTGDDVDRLHVQFDEELRERDDVVGIARDGHAFAVEVLVHVAHGVEQAAAFLADGGGHVHAAVLRSAWMNRSVA